MNTLLLRKSCRHVESKQVYSRYLPRCGLCYNKASLAPAIQVDIRRVTQFLARLKDRLGQPGMVWELSDCKGTSNSMEATVHLVSLQIVL